MPSNSSLLTYAAFLRGINVSGNKKVEMAKLQKMLEKLGYENIRTVLNSGNVIFDTVKTDSKTLARTIEQQIEKTFGFSSSVLIRTGAELQELVDSDPFAKIKVTSNTRLYITFLPEPTRSTLKIPYESRDKTFRILKVTPREVISVLEVSPTSRTTEAMSVLEKEFGKRVTTRNWNTIEKLLQMA